MCARDADLYAIVAAGCGCQARILRMLVCMFGSRVDHALNHSHTKQTLSFNSHSIDLGGNGPKTRQKITWSSTQEPKSHLTLDVYSKF